MVTTRSFMNQSWIDLNSPTKEEVDSLVLTQNIDPIVAKDLLTPTPTQYTEDKDGIIYLVLHIPFFDHTKRTSDIREIDFIISKDSLVTARYDSIDALHYFAKQTEVNEILNKEEDSHMFFGLMKNIYEGAANELSYTEDWLRDIERKIFEGKEKEMVFSISNAGRNLLNFRKTLEPHGAILEIIRDAGAEKFGNKFGKQAKTILDEWRRIMKIVGNQIDLVTELRETNNSMLSTKQNEIMKQLAIMGAILLPLTLIGQLFGLSVRSFPLINNPNAFWLVLAIMAVVGLVMLAFAKIKKWM